MAFGKDGKNDVALTENPYTTWQKLEEMVEKGKIKNIGVAKYVPFIIYFPYFKLKLTLFFLSFNIRRLEHLMSFPLKIKPSVIQYELSYWNPEPDVVKVT